MPTALVLSWLEQRMETERVIADKAILTVLHPGQNAAPAAAPAATPFAAAAPQPAHG